MALDNAHFRFYNDNGSESGATAYAAQDTTIFPDVTSGNLKLRLRIGVQNVADATLGGIGKRIQFSISGSSYAQLTTGTSGVRAFNSTNLTDEGVTTQRLTGMTGTFQAGKVTEDGVTTISVNSNNNTEFLVPVELVAADLRDGDVITFHSVVGGSISNTYTNVATIVVARHPEQRFFGMFFA